MITDAGELARQEEALGLNQSLEEIFGVPVQVGEPWYRVEFFVGAERTTAGGTLDPWYVSKDVVRILDAEFGGCTVHQAIGSWINPETQEVITEKSVHAIVLVNGNDEMYTSSRSMPRHALLEQVRRVKAEFEGMFEQTSVPILVTAVDTVEF
jgi:hypothetical protein